MFRFRCRLRTLMAVVAIIAASSGLYEMRRRGQSYRLRGPVSPRREPATDQRRHHFFLHVRPHEVADRTDRSPADGRAAGPLESLAVSPRLYAKYERAGHRPWLPVRSDPPAPPGGNPVLVTSVDY
jgi:hypothetical protein